MKLRDQVGSKDQENTDFSETNQVATGYQSAKYFFLSSRICCSFQVKLRAMATDAMSGANLAGHGGGCKLHRYSYQNPWS
jgi:hypothetical protein